MIYLLPWTEVIRGYPNRKDMNGDLCAEVYYYPSRKKKWSFRFMKGKNIIYGYGFETADAAMDYCDQKLIENKLYLIPEGQVEKFNKLRILL